MRGIEYLDQTLMSIDILPDYNWQLYTLQHRRLRRETVQARKSKPSEEMLDTAIEGKKPGVIF